MRVVAIVQARMGSTRLPNKVMKKLGYFPAIEILLSRVSKSKYLDQIIVATGDFESNKVLIQFVENLGYDCFVGSEDDVLDRFKSAAKKYNADILLRLTGDCPLLDPQLIDEMIIDFKSRKVDYLSNNYPPSYPDGLDVEILTFNALDRASNETKMPYNREHVTSYIRESNDFSTAVFSNSVDLSWARWTLDEESDLIVLQNVFKHFSPRIDFSWKEVLKLQQEQPGLFSENKSLIRNEGSTLSSGQKLWKRAKAIIPGGNMLLSKRSEMFLPDQWPSYYSQTKGCKVWDLDGNEYIDMSLMGVGTNTLGYSHADIDACVHRAIKMGNMSTLNCPEEVYLAEKLIEIHPWAEMVRFARSGGEANAIAIRIARAASGKDKVAICGYHGWHDWYLSANINDDESLDGHLLPGLKPKGVPKNLANTVLPFQYNDYDQLEELVNNHDIGVIKMEVIRNQAPKNNFLQRVRKLASDKNIVLIFDECTSGFRETFGGIHKKYDVNPDMAVFGKALGNGYAISAVIGKRSVMDSAQNTFISSTFWTERIGSVAGLATLKAMEKIKSWELITQAGLSIRSGWLELAKKYNLNIECWGIPSLGGFTFHGANALAYKTLITQEMLAKKYLAGTSVYTCVDHNQKIIDAYLFALDSIFSLIKNCEDGQDVAKLLRGPVCYQGFKRLN